MTISSNQRDRGFSLVEVMIAVLVLTFGLLALSALQGGLFRASAEAKARSNASAIAQHVIENARTFAFVSAPMSPYAAGTYVSLASAALPQQEVGGVMYAVQRDVTRYSYKSASGKFTADAATTGAVDATIPEFKEVKVTVSWVGNDAVTKTLQLLDSVAAISPSDSVQVVKTPTDTGGGPQVWKVPSSKGNPQVVPIAFGEGSDKAAASSNPKPEQFIEDLSSATTFSVETFAGSAEGEEVLVTRKLDVAAVSCLCTRSPTDISTASKPAFQPTVWNGMQQAYIAPQPAPAGTKVGRPVTVNADITPLCTVCCRDHHESAGRSPRPDPYRALSAAEAAQEHWGYRKQGAQYQTGEALIPLGADTSNEYLEACQVIRVDGLFRMAVDAQQNDLMMAPLNDAKTGYRDGSFVTNYSAYVQQHLRSAMANLPGGYVSPTARFPLPSAALKSSYASLTTPATIDVTSSTVGTTRKLSAFGLYVDYISPDTRAAYNCALNRSNAGACAGLGNLNPLEVLPFYAVNVANLGSWRSSRTGAVTVSDAIYKLGLIDTEGGVATVQSGTYGTTSQPQNILVTLAINNSNSGLAGTLPVDPDDASTANIMSVLQNFMRSGATTVTPSRNSLFVKTSSSSLLTVQNLTARLPAGAISACQIVGRGDPTKDCEFDSPAVLTTLSLTGYTTVSKGVVADRKVCGPSGIGMSETGAGTASATVTFTFSNLLVRNYTLVIDVVNRSSACPAGTQSFG